MNKQLGASFTVRGYLILLLIAAGALGGATNVYLAKHREIVIEMSLYSPAAHAPHVARPHGYSI